MPTPLLAAAAKAAAPMLKKAAAKAVKRKAVSTAQKAVSKKEEEENQAKKGLKVKKYNNGGKGDPKKKGKTAKQIIAESKSIMERSGVSDAEYERHKNRIAKVTETEKQTKIKNDQRNNPVKKGGQKKAFTSKSLAAKAELEAKIKKAKGTPAAKALVEKYRSMFKAMKGAKVKKYAAGGGPMDPTLDPTEKSNAPSLSGDPFSKPIAKSSSAKEVTESADEAKVPAGEGKSEGKGKKAAKIIGKQRANYDKRRATGEGKAARSSMMSYKKGGKAKKFPDLTGDGKVTMADILKGRGVVAKNGAKVKKKKKYVAKGADKADVRGDRKAARINKRLKRKA